MPIQVTTYKGPLSACRKFCAHTVGSTLFQTSIERESIFQYNYFAPLLLTLTILQPHYLTSWPFNLYHGSAVCTHVYHRRPEASAERA